MFSYRSSTMNRMHTWITIAFSMVTVFANSDLNKGYYWRGYNQEIPKDAFIAITTKLGKYIYVAKKVPDPNDPWCLVAQGENDYFDITTSHRSLSKCQEYRLLIVSGQICEGKNIIEYEWAYESRKANKDFQILCTHQPKDFEWIKTNGTDILSLVGSRYLVPGGVQDNHDTYIGRAFLEYGVFVGKVIYVDNHIGFYSATENCRAVGYYWRGYNQEIPKDAFIALTTKSGKNIYVAKKVPDPNDPKSYPTWEIDDSFNPTSDHPPLSKCHDYELLIVVSGQIWEGKNRIEYEWEYEGHQAKTDFQILCTHQPQDFEWLKTNGRDILSLVGTRYLVPGGVQDNHDTYIGRVFLKDAEFVGKVVYVEDHMGFYCVTADQMFVIKKNFEVLAYNPK